LANLNVRAWGAKLGSDHSGSENGFAQVLVLFSLATLCGLLTVALTQGLRTSQYSRALDLQLRGGAVARSGVDIIIDAIENPSVTLETALLGAEVPYVTMIAGTDTQFEIQAEAGKINPATIELELLAGYLTDAAVPPQTQTELLAALRMPRDEVDGLAALREVHAHLLPFIDMQQLRRDFGIWNTAAGIDPTFASRAVLSAVPDITDADVESLILARWTNPDAGRPVSRYFSRSRAVFCAVATVHWDENRIASYAEAIEITNGGRVLKLSHSCGY
jgi:hypothetical protein